MLVLHIVCGCITVYKASLLILIILGTDSDVDVCDGDDHYDSMGYGSDFEEFLDEYYD